MKKYLLESVVFISGFIVLTYEIVGARVLAPYYGTSTYVWTAMIGIILASLAIGYTIGGHLADRKNARIEILSLIIYVSGIAVMLTYILYTPILNGLSKMIEDIRIGSVVAAIILFLPASVLLGMVSPYATRLRIAKLDGSGKTIGMMGALGTFGSIAGTFVSGFYLIPYFGMSTLLGLIPICLILLSIAIDQRHLIILKGASLILIALFLYQVGNTRALGVLEEVDTVYSHVRVYDSVDQQTGERLRTMGINRENHSTRSLDSDRLVNDYTNFYHLAYHFFPVFGSGLMLGGAGYSFPQSFLDTYSDATIDVVEIDPGVTLLARKYFGLRDHPHLQIYHEDGRVFLNNTKNQYDVIFGDAFSSWYSIPYQLSTLEAIQKKHNILSDEGGVILNIISSLSGETSEFLRAEYHTYKQIFPQVYILPVSTDDPTQIQNIILIALKSRDEPSWVSENPYITQMLERKYSGTIPNDLPIITDDYAPVDHYVGKFLRHIH